MSDVAVTELTKLQADEVHGVGMPANGASWLLVKAQAEDEEHGHKFEENMRRMKNGEPLLTKDEAEKSDSAEADEIALLLTEEASKCAALEHVDAAASKAQEEAEKAIKAKKKEKPPVGVPADAMARFKSEIKDAKENPTDHVAQTLHRCHEWASTGRYPKGMTYSDVKEIAATCVHELHSRDKKSDATMSGFPAKKGIVQDALHGTATPEASGHLDTGKSGLAGSVTGGPRMTPVDNSQTLGGQSAYTIPAESTMARGWEPPAATTDGLLILNPQAARKALTVASMAVQLEEIAERQAAVKGDGFLTALPDGAAPGSGPWESYDSATLRQVSECLAGCCHALDAITQRERIEALSGDAGDMGDAWDLEDASDALEFALSIAARLSYHEQAEGEAAKSAEEFAAKVGRVISGKNLESLHAARDHLNAVIEGAEAKPESAQEEDIMASITKDELSAIIAEEARKAAREERKAAQKEAKKAQKKAEKKARKEAARNGGNVTTGDMKPTARADAGDPNAIPSGGHVDPQFVNAPGDVAKALEKINKQLDKLGRRPQAGGPSLDGVLRGIGAASEGRIGGEVAKGQDGEIERLTKSLEQTTDPVVKERLGSELTHARLTQAYEGRFGSA